MTRAWAATACLVLMSAADAVAVPVTLRGSPESMARQNRVAQEGEATFLRTPADVYAAVESGELVAVEGNADYVVNRISFPYARPETRLFLERFSAQYRAACGEPLVVTSLTRPQSRQPANAHRLSVHPTGLAVDLRVSQKTQCRSYLESTLLAMERDGVLDVTRERTPPHYHLAIFPEAYMEYIGETLGDTSAPDWQAAVESDPEGWGAEALDVPGIQGLRATGAVETDERAWGGWLGRLLTLPIRVVGRLFG